MRFSLACASVLAVLVSASSAQAFTFEGSPAAPSGANAVPSGSAAGLAGTDPASVLPPVSEPTHGLQMDISPASRNNGFAPPPDPRNSVGPSWLYGPR